MSADSDLSKEYIKLLASTQVRSNGIFLLLTARITSKAIERGEQFVRNSDSGGTSSGNGFSANGTSSRGAQMTLGERGFFLRTFSSFSSFSSSSSSAFSSSIFSSSWDGFSSLSLLDPLGLPLRLI